MSRKELSSHWRAIPLFGFSRWFWSHARQFCKFTVNNGHILGLRVSFFVEAEMPRRRPERSVALHCIALHCGVEVSGVEVIAEIGCIVFLSMTRSAFGIEYGLNEGGELNRAEIVGFRFEF